MIVEKKLQQQQHIHMNQQDRRHLQLAAATSGDTEEEEEDGDNDEENIVIDMADEEDDDDDVDVAGANDNNDYINGFDSINYHQFGTISVYNNNNNSNSTGRKSNNNNTSTIDQYAYSNYDTKTLHQQQQQHDSSQTQSAESSSAEQEAAAADHLSKINVGDLIWFDPNQLGYSIPGKVIEFYAGLTAVLTVEGCAQPDPEMALKAQADAEASSPGKARGANMNYEAYNRLLLDDQQEERLQAYDLSDLQQFRTIKLRLPMGMECGISDLLDLDELSQESIIWNLKLRYKQDLVYTRCGHKLLVSLNPHRQLSNVYNLHQVNKYDTINSNKLASLTIATGSLFNQQNQLKAAKAAAAAASRNSNRLRQTNRSTRSHCRATQQATCEQSNSPLTSSSLIRWLVLHDGLPAAAAAINDNGNSKLSNDPAREEPHLFGMANEALKRLLISGQDQCFVLLGESGSGKTECSKLLVQYLATVNKSPSNLMTEQILESMQVLESFGNAKTIHNDNSSRFGKLLDLRFNLLNGFILDAKTIDLNLLDRTRIVSQAGGERNYHIFYELLAGLSRSEKEKYGLQGAEKYFYLNQGHCNELPGKEDGEDFRSLLASMQVLGFNYEEQDTIFRLLASVLHLGNIYFHRKVLAVRSGKLAQQLAAPTGVEGVEIGSDTEVRWVSHLLQIQFDSVMRCLTVRTTEATCSGGGGGSSMLANQPSMMMPQVDRIVTPLNIDQALDTRDAIARALYTCLFRWLIQRINAMIHNAQPEPCQTGSTTRPNANNNNNREPVYLCRTSESLCEFQPDRLAHLTDQSRQSSLARSQARGTTSSNSIISSHPTSGEMIEPALVEASAATMTILDAFGFENLAENNFEQLCINYTAELLHYHTNRHLLRLEQAEYAKERLIWEPISQHNHLATAGSINGHVSVGGSMVNTANAAITTTNGPSAIVNLISKKPLGILALLDDECNFPKATDQSFVEKCHHNHTLNDNYQRARLASNNQEFGIRHFRQQSRTVWYQVEGFIEKNRDSLRPDIVDLLVGSKMSIVVDMLRKLHRSQEVGGGSGGSGGSGGAGAKTLSRTYDGRYVSMKPRTTTVAARFQDALHNNRVLESINCSPSMGPSQAATMNPPATNESSQYSTIGAALTTATAATGTGSRPNPWFVMCLKPNQSRTGQVFDVAYVQDQVRSMGLLELVKIRKLGYPIRLRYGEFVRRYKCLVPQSFLNGLASCQDIQAANRRLNANEHRNRETTKQKLANGHEIKRAIRDVCSAIIDYRFKKNPPDEAEEENPNRMRQYQCGLTKMFLNERLYHEMEQMRLIEHQRAIQSLQKCTRGWLIRRQFLLRRQASIVIQTQVRGWLARREYWRQYLLIVVLQRHWRRQLIVRRRRALEARRKAKRQQQQQQLQELQAQQRKQADQFRYRLQPNQLVAAVSNGRRAAGHLDIPEELAQLYRLQQSFVPVHDLNNVNEIDLLELVRRERQRRQRHSSNRMSVPFVVVARTNRDEEDHIKEAMETLEDDNYSLQNLILRHYTLNVPQFGYSRLPITRPFSWPRLTRKRTQQLRRARKRGDPEELGHIQVRFETVEQKAVAIYKLMLRYIDSDLNEPQQHQHQYHSAPTSDPPIEKVIKFKLIADYIIYLCLNEPLLRDEIYLQLISQSWQNHKPKSVENVWKLMVNCLSCFRPQDSDLIKFLFRHANDYCVCENYRQIVLKALASNSHHHRQHDVSNPVSSCRKYPPTILEYWAHHRAVGQLALSASCYMDDHALNGPPIIPPTSGAIGDGDDNEHDPSPAELSAMNHSNKTIVQIEPRTIAEHLARSVLEARGVPEANLVGWSVEIQHEGAQSEFSCRLRGDDLVLDHFSHLELLPEFAALIDDECNSFNWVPPPLELSMAPSVKSNLSKRRSTSMAPASTNAASVESDGGSRSLAGRGRKQQVSASEFCVPHQQVSSTQVQNSVTPVSGHRLSLMSQRSTDSSFISSRRQSSELDLASAARLSQNSKLNRRYMRNSAESENSAPTNSHFYQQQQQQERTYAPLSHQGAIYHHHHHHHQNTGQLHQSYQQQQQHGYPMMSPTEPSRMMGHRRSMSMQELQLASSALNGRYFGGGGGPQHQQQVASGHYASSHVTGSSPHDMDPHYHHNYLQKVQRNVNGSLQQLPMYPHHHHQHYQAPSGRRRRSQTPNSMSAYGYGPGQENGRGSFQARETIGGEQRRSRLMERGSASGSLSRGDFKNGHQFGRSPNPLRSASSSSRMPHHAGQPHPSGPSSDYASACSDYERVGSGAARYATPSQLSGPSVSGPSNTLASSSSASSQGIMMQQQRQRQLSGRQSPLTTKDMNGMMNSDGHRSTSGGPIRPPPNPLIERYKLAGHGRNRRKPRNPEVDDQDHGLPPRLHQLQQQQALPPAYGAVQGGHYMGSSAMSDSSEAPSLASHVRGIKVPVHNADLDQYLDDLFNPVLDEAELDELSDARSLATSIRGASQKEDEDLSILMDADRLGRAIRGTTNNPGELANIENTITDRETATLSPTFESLLESLQGGSGGHQRLASSSSCHREEASTPLDSTTILPPEPLPTNTSEVFNQLGAMNLSELKALNEQLEHQIQAAQSNRPSLDLQSCSSSGDIQQLPLPPPPPPLPDFGLPPTEDDVYSRAKTIRIGKWRWPPARDDASLVEGQTCSDSQTEVEEQQTNDSLPELTSNPGLDASKLEVKSDIKLMPPPPPPPPSIAAAATVSSSGKFTSLDQNPGGSVGKLKISSEMKAKLEQLTNGSGSSGRESAASTAAQSQSPATGLVSQATKSLLSASSDSNGSVKRLAEQRKNLLEHQLLGALQATHAATGSEPPPEINGTATSGHNSPSIVGSKILAAKQQLAAAAGVALAALDSSPNSRASSRRQSTAPVDHAPATDSPTVASGTNLDERRSRVLQDELGPQTRAAISQRQAFYLMSASSDQLDHLNHPNELELGGSEIQLSDCRTTDAGGIVQPPSPPTLAVSSDNLMVPSATATTTTSKVGKQRGAGNTKQPPQLTRSMQMSNLSELGRDGYGHSIAKSMVQRQHESLAAAKTNAPTTSCSGDQWVSTSPDPAGTGSGEAIKKRPKVGQSGSGKNLSQASGGDLLRRSNNAQQQQHQQSNKLQRVSSSRLASQDSAHHSRTISQDGDDISMASDNKSCFLYGNVDWQVKIRKEFFMPSETYEDPLVVQLVFAQLVADVFNPRHWTRLNNKERAAIKSLMKDNSIGYSPSLPQIGQLQPVKQELVRMARSFGLYFTRSYPAYNFSLIADQLQGDGMSQSQLRRRSHSTSSRPTSGCGGNSSPSSSEADASSDSGDLDGRHQPEEQQTERGGSRHSHHSHRQALRLMNRLRNANNLGTNWIDMVAVHHSGLRLVAIEQQPQQQLHQRPLSSASGGTLPPPWSPAGGELATPTQMSPFGYRVLETLKYRDMSDVSQIGQHELLVSMSHGKKSWLISSDKASQLGNLLKCFHADYNDLVAASSKPTRDLQQHQQQAKGSKQPSSSQIQQKRQQKKHTNPSGSNKKDALLASDDDDHGDHIEQRQVANRFASLHQAPHTNDGLANGDRILPINRANDTETSISKQPPPITSSHDNDPVSLSAAAAAAADGQTNKRAIHRLQPTSDQVDESLQSATSVPSNNNQLEANSNKSKSAKKNLWQNSLSRMSNKFSLFGGSQSRAGGTTSSNSSAKANKQKQQQQQQVTSNPTQQVALDAWIETKVDFGHDEDDNNENNNNIGTLNKSQVSSASMKLGEQEQQQQQHDEQNEQSLSQQADSGGQQPEGNQPVDAASSKQQAEDGKYSLLQFALYNFREAVDKYSLESRASKIGAMGQQAGDTSTLRGSLKLIESLRLGGSVESRGDSGSQSHHGTSTSSKDRKSTGRSRRRLPISVTTGGGGGGSQPDSDWTWRELAEMVKFTSRPIKQSLLKLPSDDLNKRAVECFLAIMQYMGDLPEPSAATGGTNPKHPPPSGEVECVYLILMNCHNYPLLRDEIYCQLMKQTTNNRSQQPDSCLRGWRLFSIVAAYFDCSPTFKPYLLKYLETAAYDKRRAYCSVAALCLQNLRKTLKYNGRKNVPSIEEIAATSAGRNSKRQIYRLPGGTERVINTKSTTVVEDIIYEICYNMLNVTEPDEMLEFSLYCIADGDLYTMPLNRDEYILDITTELIKNHQQYFLIFCRSIWHYPLRLDSKLYIEVIFNQIAPDYLEGLLLVLPAASRGRSSDRGHHRGHTRQETTATTTTTKQPLRLKTKLVNEVARIAALLHRASGTDYMPHKDEVKYLLPKPIITAMKYHQRSLSGAPNGSHTIDNQPHQQQSAASSTSGSSSNNNNDNGGPRSLVGGGSNSQETREDSCHLEETAITTPSKWVELVQTNWREMSAFDTLDAKAQFLDIIRHWPLFGSSFFAIKLIQRDLIQPMDYILALNKLGIQMLDMSTHETKHKYPFNEVISTRKVRSEDGALYLDLKCGNLMKRTIIRIQTDQAHEISRLIRQYIDIEQLQQKQSQQQQQQQHQSVAAAAQTTTGGTENDANVNDDGGRHPQYQPPAAIATNGGKSEQESS